MSWDEAKYWRDLWYEEQRAYAELSAAVLAGTGRECLRKRLAERIAYLEAETKNDAVVS